MPQDTTSLLNVVDTEPDDDIVPFINLESALSDHPCSCTKIGLSVFVEGIIVYIAGWVVRSVTKQVSCKECSLALISPASECTSALLKMKNKIGLVPSPSVVQIVRHCEIVLRSCVNIKRVVPGQWEKMLVSRMLVEMPSDLFVELNDHFMETSKGGQVGPIPFPLPILKIPEISSYILSCVLQIHSYDKETTYNLFRQFAFIYSHAY